eukprot:2213480-Rhodomonas_salina.1
MLCASCNERLAQTNGFFGKWLLKWMYVTGSVSVAIDKAGHDSTLEVQYSPPFNRPKTSYYLTVKADVPNGRFLRFTLPRGNRTFTLPLGVQGLQFEYDVYANTLTQLPRSQC